MPPLDTFSLCLYKAIYIRMYRDRYPNCKIIKTIYIKYKTKIYKNSLIKFLTIINLYYLFLTIINLLFIPMYNSFVQRIKLQIHADN